jgi:hypothetical protein
MAGAALDKDVKRFLLVRDNFYDNPDEVRRIAQSMEFKTNEDFTGLMTDQVYHPRDIRRRLEKILGVRISRWDSDPSEGNGVFYGGFSAGKNREVPGVHSDEPYTDITVVVYLTPGIPPAYGTSLWQHGRTGLVNAPTAADARRLKTTLGRLRERLERESTDRSRWVEIDRAGYRYNRMVAYASGMLHSATRHYGADLKRGRIYQTFRIGVDWRTCQIQK